MASIYEIEQRILDCIDFETGEILDSEKLNALQVERSVKIENIVLWIKNLEYEASAIKDEESVLKQRRNNKENLAERLKDYVGRLLDGMKFETPKCRVSFRRSTQVNIIDETAIPSEYTKTEIVTKIDKKAIGDALKGGELIDGAELKDNLNIQIK